MRTPESLKKVYSGTGLHLVWSSGTDIKLFLLLRMVRLFAYGGTTLILALYLAVLGFPDTKVGLFMTLTLVGDLAIGMVLTYIGDGMGVRATAAIGSLLMVGSGFAFAFLDNYWLLLLASIAGAINPSGNEVDPFKAIEESAIARLSTPENCIDLFAWWSMLGMLGTAGSVLLTGVTVETLQKAGLTALDSYRVIFLAYSGVGMLKFFLCLMLSSQVELTRSIEKSPAEADDCSEEDQSPLLANNEDAHYSTFDPLAAAKLDRIGKLEPRQMFTSSSFSFMWRLSLAMALDFIGSGLAQVSWMVYFFKREYDVAEGPLGTAIFAAGIASSILNLFSPALSRRIGNVPTMVVCHTLNSITLLMVSIPNNKTLALILFILRIVTREMDNAPRQAFISAGVLEEERTSAMGVVNVVKTVGSCLGLFLTGEFAGMGKFWIAFTLAGSLKLGYNVLIAAFFWNHRGNRG